MEPHKVDELVHARGMGPNIHQKDAEDHVKRTKQMLAKVGDADSSVDNAAQRRGATGCPTNGVRWGPP